MTKRRIHIEHLKIRLPRSAVGEARNIADGLGREILQGLAESTAARTGAKRIEGVSAGKLTTAGDTGASRLQKEIAARIADQVGKSFG